MPVPARWLLLLLCLAPLAGCRTTTQQAPVGLSEAILLPTPAVRAWTLMADGSRVGSIVRYQEATGPGRHVFAVRNIHDQDLGLIDALGRAWRMRPHAEPDLLGSGTVREGAARILGLDQVEMVAAELD
jgi:hypothetical protein